MKSSIVRLVKSVEFRLMFAFSFMFSSVVDFYMWFTRHLFVPSFAIAIVSLACAVLLFFMGADSE